MPWFSRTHTPGPFRVAVFRAFLSHSRLIQQIPNLDPAIIRVWNNLCATSHGNTSKTWTHGWMTKNRSASALVRYTRLSCEVAAATGTLGNYNGYLSVHQTNSFPNLPLSVEIISPTEILSSPTTLLRPSIILGSKEPLICFVDIGAATGTRISRGASNYQQFFSLRRDVPVVPSKNGVLHVDVIPEHLLKVAYDTAHQPLHFRNNALDLAVTSRLAYETLLGT